MAEKVKELGLKRDYTKYLYFLDKDGNICQKAKSGEGKTEVVVENPSIETISTCTSLTKRAMFRGLLVCHAAARTKRRSTY